MPSPGTTHSQLKQLKKAIQAEVHRTTGRRPPVLANNAAFEDPITFEDLAPNNAWYILPNTTNGNKIHHLYKKSTLNQILATSRKSPFTRKPITNRNIRKYMNFSARTAPPSAPVVINLTGNNTAPRTTVVRPRHGLFSDPHVQRGLKRLMVAASVGSMYKIKTNFTRQIYMKKINANAYDIFLLDATRTLHASEATFIPKLQEFLQHFSPSLFYTGFTRLR